MIYECPPLTYFDPLLCACTYVDVVNPNIAHPELFMAVIDIYSNLQIVEYPFSFHPYEIIDDPEYPDDPIDNQVVDCAGVTGGSAYNSCCGCIGGTTGIADCSELSDPNVGAITSIVEVSPSAASITALGLNWGYTEDESIDLTIGATLANCVWKAKLISAKGNYSIQACLIAGVSEGAEHAHVDPMGKSICNLANTKPYWPACSSCPY